MDTKQPLSLFLVAILAASVFTVVGITSIPLKTASAQDITIETSADELGGTFFGHAALRVIIEDDSADDDEFDDIDVDITVEDESDSFTIPNTSNGSQTFEFFIIHADSAIGVELDGIADTPTIVTFGSGGDLDTSDDLFTDATVDIDYENVDATVQYESQDAVLSTDRDTYGSESIVHIFIDDQDGNLNPTETDEFTINATTLATLFDVDGGTFLDDVTFEETGTNTAMFEGEVSLENGATVEFQDTDEIVDLTLNDQNQYNVNGTFDESGGGSIFIEDGGINDSVETSSTNFEVDDVDGTIDDLSNPTFGSELVAVVRDDDQNIDSDEEDDINDVLLVESNGGFLAGGDSEEVDLTETDENTGVFEIDASNGELKIEFLADTQTPAQNNGILELNADDIDEDITVSYIDPLDDDSNVDVEVALNTLEMETVAGAISAPETTGVNDEFVATLTDQDLNNDPRVRDSYTIVLNQTGPYQLSRATLNYSDMYTFEFELDGDSVDFGAFGTSGNADLTYTVTETGINTGIFEFDVDMEDIGDFGNNGADLTIEDEEDFEITIHDFMADSPDDDEDSTTVSIGKPTVGTDFSRTNVPIPPQTGSATLTDVGTTVITTLQLTDPQLADDSAVEEVEDFEFTGEDGGDAVFEWTIEVDGEVDETISSEAELFGDTNCDDGGAGAAGGAEAEVSNDVSLCTVLGIEDGTDLEGVLEETGDDTGVFEWELEFVDVADMSIGDWQDLEITFNYFDDESEEESSGFTFRGNDGIVTVDQPSAKPGTVVTVTIEDQDLNLDDADTETFESGGILTVETEDETIEDIAGCPAIDEQDFDETGDDTGVFTAEFIVGDDIQVSCLDDDTVEQATNILITYDDEIDSTGGSGDDVEVNVPVASSTGSIQVTPELVGPATELTILIIDTDLDEDADSIDEYTAPAGSETSDDFFVSFSSDRNEVGEGSPDIEETGANTGVFMFTLQLETDEEQCQDDELDEDFEALGGDTDSEIGACPGDLISIRYEDELTGGGGSTTVSEVVEVSAFDPEFVADQDSYNVGDRVTVTISDPDANRDADIADSLPDIRVRSDSDQVGEEFSAIETGEDTGVFRLTFGTTSGTASGSISVNQGDDISITYTDEFPADFEEEEEDKDFQFTVSVGGVGSVGSTTVTPPEPTDVTGQPLDEVSTGQQVVLTTNVQNTLAGPQEFVALIEVRDDSGVTIFLAWQTGTLPANGSTQVGLSWTPENPGDYEVRTFVISDLNNPQVLSLVSSSNITVN